MATTVEIIVKGTDRASGALRGVAGALSSLGRMAAGATVAGMGAAALAIGGAGRTAISVESAFAGVIKTTDGLADEMGNLTDVGQALKQEFRDLATAKPLGDVEDLLAIGELGGQLGIAREELVGFSETIASLDIATNLNAEEAASQLAQFSNIMGTAQSDIGRLGSTIVDLGNNFATTERDILNFSSRIAGAGKIAGLTEANVFAIGTAMSSVGVEAEAGGTAVQKTLLDINEAVLTSNDSLAIYARTAGVSASEFASAWREDAGQAFTDFVEGLGRQGEEAIFTLQELGLEDQRLIRAFLSLAGAGDVLDRAMGSANTAFQENIALTKEAEARFRTTESRIQLVKNQFRDLGLTIGDIVLPYFNNLLGAVSTFITDAGPGLVSSIERNIGLLRDAFVSLQLGMAGEWTDDPEAILPIHRVFGNLGIAIREFQRGFGEGRGLLQSLFLGGMEVADDFLPQSFLTRIYDLRDAISAIRNRLSDGDLRGALGVIFPPLVAETISSIAEAAGRLAANIGGFLETVRSEGVEAALMAMLPPAWAELVPKVADDVGRLRDNLQGAVDTALGSESAGEALSALVGDEWAGRIERAAGALGGVAREIGHIVATNPEQVATELRGIAAALAAIALTQGAVAILGGVGAGLSTIAAALSRINPVLATFTTLIALGAAREVAPDSFLGRIGNAIYEIGAAILSVAPHMGPLLISLGAIAGVAAVLISNVGLSGLVAMLAGPVVAALGAAAVAAAPVAIALGLLALAVLGLKIAWDRNLGGIQERTAELVRVSELQWADLKRQISDYVELTKLQWADLKRQLSEFRGSWERFWNGLRNTVQSGVSTILGWITDLRNAIADVMAAIDRLRGISIPRFDDLLMGSGGGFGVPAPTPPRTGGAQSFRSNNLSFAPGAIVIQGSSDPEENARVVIRELDSWMRRIP